MKEVTLLKVVVIDGVPRVEHASDEVLARYAVDKARSVVDVHFNKVAPPTDATPPDIEMPQDDRPRILSAFPGGLKMKGTRL